MLRSLGSCSVCCSVLQCVLQCVAVCVAVCCRVCCSVLQCCVLAVAEAEYRESRNSQKHTQFENVLYKMIIELTCENVCRQGPLLQCISVVVVALCCSVLQCVAVCCSMCCSVLQCSVLAVAVCCRVLRNVAVCCSVLQCVAVCWLLKMCAFKGLCCSALVSW